MSKFDDMNDEDKVARIQYLFLKSLHAGIDRLETNIEISGSCDVITVRRGNVELHFLCDRVLIDGEDRDDLVGG